MKRLALVLLLTIYSFAQASEYQECADAGVASCQNNLALFGSLGSCV
jgi:hypothetical protein